LGPGWKHFWRRAICRTRALPTRSFVSFVLVYFELSRCFLSAILGSLGYFANSGCLPTLLSAKSIFSNPARLSLHVPADVHLWRLTWMLATISCTKSISFNPVRPFHVDADMDACHNFVSKINILQSGLLSPEVHVWKLTWTLATLSSAKSIFAALARLPLLFSAKPNYPSGR